MQVGQTFIFSAFIRDIAERKRAEIDLQQAKDIAEAARIRQNPALLGATILMLSSADLSGDAASSRELGIPIYLTKPIIQSELWNAIINTLRRAAQQDIPAPPVSPLTAPGTQQRFRILLAEDNPVNQTLTVRMLEKRRHQVEVVSTGKEALAALTRHTFDLVLMDVQMAEMDSIEATAAIRAQEHQTSAHLPIIAMTAHAMKGDQERCLAAGMDSYVAKPMQGDDLYSAIGRLLKDALAPEIAPLEPPVDVPTALRSMDGDKAMLADVVEVFHQDYPRHVRAFREAISDNVVHQLERAAHSLKGTLGAVGATTAYALASELETMGRAAHLEGASIALAKLTQTGLGRGHWRINHVAHVVDLTQLAALAARMQSAKASLAWNATDIDA
jgi:CheY-like chemotaxis protein/HPt (histidine-containing phosphotransfer) domain-containing protein